MGGLSSRGIRRAMGGVYVDFVFWGAKIYVSATLRSTHANQPAEALQIGLAVARVRKKLKRKGYCIRILFPIHRRFFRSIASSTARLECSSRSFVVTNQKHYTLHNGKCPVEYLD
jgi:hypothetical protein